MNNNCVNHIPVDGICNWTTSGSVGEVHDNCPWDRLEVVIRLFPVLVDCVILLFSVDNLWRLSPCREFSLEDGMFLECELSPVNVARLVSWLKFWFLCLFACNRTRKPIRKARNNTVTKRPIKTPVHSSGSTSESFLTLLTCFPPEIFFGADLSKK